MKLIESWGERIRISRHPAVEDSTMYALGRVDGGRIEEVPLVRHADHAPRTKRIVTDCTA
jgi:hypothetical protein